MSTQISKAQLRKVLRDARRALTEKQQLQAEAQLANTARSLLRPRHTKHAAFYLPSDGEISPLGLMQFCRSMGVNCYLPVLHSLNGRLWFGEYHPHTELLANRFGIPEPLHEPAIRLWQLDVVFLPLVGFDPSGNRLGMGGGFYDRTFADRLRWPRQPKLYGLAHQLQQVDALPADSWDIPLDGIITEQKIIPVNERRKRTEEK